MTVNPSHTGDKLKNYELKIFLIIVFTMLIIPSSFALRIDPFIDPNPCSLAIVKDNLVIEKDKDSEVFIGLDNKQTGGRHYKLISSGLNDVGKFSIIDATAGKSRLTIDNGGIVGIGTLTNCNTIDTDSSGQLRCGIDEVGAAETDPFFKAWADNPTSPSIPVSGSCSSGFVTGISAASAPSCGTVTIPAIPPIPSGICTSGNYVTGISGATVSCGGIYSNGNFGIGITTPQTPLDISNSGKPEIGAANSGLTCGDIWDLGVKGTVTKVIWNAGGAGGESTKIEVTSSEPIKKVSGTHSFTRADNEGTVTDTLPTNTIENIKVKVAGGGKCYVDAITVYYIPFT